MNVRAFFSPEGVIVLTVALATAIAGSEPLIIVPGLLAYAVLTFGRIERERSRAPRIAGIVVLEGRIREAIGAVSSSDRAMLAPCAERARSLVLAATELEREIDALTKHFQASQRTAPLPLERVPVIDVQRRHEAMSDLTMRRDRAIAELASIELALETLLARVLAIRTNRTAAASTRAVRETLDELGVEAEAIAETLDEPVSPMNGGHHEA